MCSPVASNEVLLIIFSFLDIDTFLSVRLLSRDVNALLSSNSFFLHRSVAASTFPKASKTFLQAQEYDLRWLKRLRYKQIAAIILECCSVNTPRRLFEDTNWILAQDPL